MMSCIKLVDKVDKPKMNTLHSSDQKLLALYPVALRRGTWGTEYAGSRPVGALGTSHMLFKRNKCNKNAALSVIMRRYYSILNETSQLCACLQPHTGPVSHAGPGLPLALPSTQRPCLADMPSPTMHQCFGRTRNYPSDLFMTNWNPIQKYIS